MTAFVLLVFGCAPAIENVEVRVLDDMPTIAEVTWTTAREVTAQVRFGSGSALDRMTPYGAATTEHQALLLGLPATTPASFQVVTADGDESEVHEVETGTLPDDFPSFALDGTDLGQFMVTPVFEPGGFAGVAILDSSGRLVWQHVDERGLFVSRAVLAADGSGVVYNASELAGNDENTQELVWVSWEGTEVRSEVVTLLGHDFVQKADGTLVTLVHEERDTVAGTKLVEIAPDGTQTDTWSAWDCFEPEETSHDEMEMGWTWANALDHDDSTDVYTLSLRNFGSIVSVDGASGACDWALGGLVGTVDIIGDTFEHQHQFARTDETMVVFDNDGQGTRSRVIEYAFDPTTGTAEQVWSYTFPLWNVVLGDVHRLDDGDTLVVWAVHGRVDRITPEGEVAANLVTEEDMVIGFVALENDLYVPQ